jgi:hypothetical protein
LELPIESTRARLRAHNIKTNNKTNNNNINNNNRHGSFNTKAGDMGRHPNCSLIFLLTLQQNLLDGTPFFENQVGPVVNDDAELNIGTNSIHQIQPTGETCEIDILDTIGLENSIVTERLCNDDAKDLKPVFQVELKRIHPPDKLLCFIPLESYRMFSDCIPIHDILQVAASGRSFSKTISAAHCLDSALTRQVENESKQGISSDVPAGVQVTSENKALDTFLMIFFTQLSCRIFSTLAMIKLDKMQTHRKQEKSLSPARREIPSSIKAMYQDMRSGQRVLQALFFARFLRFQA